MLRPKEVPQVVAISLRWRGLGNGPANDICMSRMAATCGAMAPVARSFGRGGDLLDIELSGSGFDFIRPEEYRTATFLAE